MLTFLRLDLSCHHLFEIETRRSTDRLREGGKGGGGREKEEKAVI